jgi:hypothetical protein
VEGPTCKFIETQGLLKENGLIQPWIFDPTAAAAVDRAVNPVHGSTVDRTDLSAQDPAAQDSCVRARRWARRNRERCGGVRRCFAGVASGRGSRWPKRARASATRSGKHASMPRGSGGRRGCPRRSAPEGGGSASPASSRGRR